MNADESTVPRGERNRRGGRYRNASELGTFLFCQRAWQFERQNTPSQREPERTQGTIHHRRHGERVSVTRRVQVLARGVLLLAIILFLLGLWMAAS